MKKLNIKARTVYRLVVFLFIAVVLSTYALSGPLARYVSNNGADDSARVAKYSVTTTGTLTDAFYIDGIKPGDSFEKTFKVENNSEVSIRYTVTIETTGNIPLKFDPYVIEGDLAPGESSGVKTVNISWNESDKSYLYSDAFDIVTVTIVCQQID